MGNSEDTMQKIIVLNNHRETAKVESVQSFFKFYLFVKIHKQRSNVRKIENVIINAFV